MMKHKTAWLSKLGQHLKQYLPNAWQQPVNRKQLFQILGNARKEQLLDADAISIIEGAIEVSSMKVSEIMVPCSRITMLSIHDTPKQVLSTVLETHHSRFPVSGDNPDEILGILLAKDLLQTLVNSDFSVKEHLRPAIFVPDSKPLNIMLREFLASHNHMAMVVSEYGNVIGLVTIENVLEQIVGDIQDEFDTDSSEDSIIQDGIGCWRVNASVSLDDLNQALGSSFQSKSFNTVGGLIIHYAKSIPKRGDVIVIKNLIFRVIHADSRRIYSVHVEKTKKKA